MRYSSAAITALILSFFTFLGMTLLVTTNKYTKSESFEPIEFSKINDMEKVDPATPTKPKTLPKQEEVKKPPAAPDIDITDTNDPDPGHRVIKGIAKPEAGSLGKFASPTISAPGAGEFENNRGLMSTFAIQPRYPAKAAREKIEGWVKVEFTVNEFGRPINVKVIDSKPRRIFEYETLKAIHKSKFKPMMVNGKPVSQTAVQVIEFKLEK